MEKIVNISGFAGSLRKDSYNRSLLRAAMEITKSVADNAAAERQLLFLPGALPPGIEAQDPMIKARDAAYPISYERRYQ